MSTIPTSSDPTNLPGRGLFQCSTCSKTYSRVDHLARHVRAHTQEKPYHCKACDKSFSRVDLLRRHSALHTGSLRATQNKRRRTETTSVSVRTSRACEACAEHHLKCEDEKPCRRCVSKNIGCAVAPKLAIPDNGLKLPSSTEHPRQESPVSPISSADDWLMRVPETSTESRRAGGDAFEDSNGLDPGLPEMSHYCAPPLETSQQHCEPSVDSESIHCLPTGLFASNFPSGTLTPSGLAGFGIETDLDFSAIDLSFLDSYNARAPFEVEITVNEGSNESLGATFPNPSHDGHSGRESIIPSRIFHQPIWKFVPAPGSNAYVDQANLSLPDEDDLVTTPESFGDVTRRATPEKLDSVTRDKMLAIVLSQIKPHISPAVSSFPSVDLLDTLIQFFLAGPFPKARSWIHTSTFRPKKARPELLLAIAAAGAVLTPDRSLRKLGFAIQEVVRNHIPTVFESDNTKVRDLEMSQAFMLHLEIGLYSGNSRKIEISESFQQPLLSMLRRGGRFRRSAYPILCVLSDEEGQSLDRKWRTWCEQESFKRLAYHLLSYDAHSSMALMVSPLISYSEYGLPLPETTDLWMAASALEWKALYRAKYANAGTRLPSLTECIADLGILGSSQALVDLDYACATVLYGLWGIVWEYRKLSALFGTRTSIWDKDLAKMSRQQELMKVLEYYRIHHGNRSPLLLELILMHLHMSLEDIQLFAGMDSQEDVHRVHDSMKEWVKSRTSRQAVWHAGQLVRAARLLPPLHLRDFNAIALFHASLAFWAYGLASRIFVQNMQPPQQILWLDDEETAATYRFISLQRGTPALHRSRLDLPPAYLNDQKAIIEVLTDMMKYGDNGALWPSSPLVENLVSVMERLSNKVPREQVENK